MQIFLSNGEEQTGPFSAEEFERMLKAGAVAETALYWYDGCPDWLPVAQHPSVSQRHALSVSPPPLPQQPLPTIGVRPARPLKFCRACGHSVARSAKVCPSCGGRLAMGCLPRLAIGLSALAITLLVLGVLVGVVLQAVAPQGQPKGALGSSTVEATPKPAPNTTMPLPEAERALIAAVESYVSRYAAATNELQKSALRTQRRASLASAVKDMRVSDWVGTLKKLTTDSDGKASISIQLEGSAISVHTDIGSPFDRGSDTLVDHGSSLYNKLASLSVGDRVVFTGSFLPGEKDHLKETSFTESGSMTEPEFAMRFSGVECLPAVSMAMPVVAPTLVARAQASPSVTPLPVATTTPSPVLPPDEAAFIDAIQSYVSRYSAASNELQKSAARADRARRLARLMTTMQVVRWVGTLREMKTISDGTATIAIHLPESAITVSTVWSNPFDPASKTLIDPSLSLYKRLSSMSKGSEVTFSGNFLPDDQDYIKETSFTEAGSMTEPEFAIRFADVTALASTDTVTPGVPPSLSIVQTGPPASSLAADLTPPPLSVTTPGVAARPSEGSSTGAPTNVPSSEQLLIGKWQGARHLTEYRADHTRVMDGVNLNPPRTWHLDGDQLSEGQGKNVYKVVSLDRHQLVLEGDNGTWYSHQRIQAPAVNEAGTKPLDPVSSAWMTVFNFYDWYLGCDGQGLSPWKNGSLAQRPDVTRTFAARSQGASEPEREADPILAGQHVPIRGFVIDAKVEGLVATVLVRLAVRDTLHEVNVRLVRSTNNAPWQIDDVQPATKVTPMPLPTNRQVAGANTPTYLQVNTPVRTPTTGPLVRLKVFEDEGRTCRLLLPEDGWVPVEHPPRGTRLAMEGPGGIWLSVRPLDGAVGERSLAVLFARAVKKRFPFDDIAIQPTKASDHTTSGKRTVWSFSAQTRDHFAAMLQNMPDGPMKQGMLAGAGDAANKKSTFFAWTAVSEGAVTWVVEIEDAVSPGSPAELKSKIDQSRNPYIRMLINSFHKSRIDPVADYLFMRGMAVGDLVRMSKESIFDADGLTPIIGQNKQAADAEIAEQWSRIMEVQSW